jgi:hypothetical protein
MELSLFNPIKGRFYEQDEEECQCTIKSSFHGAC